MKKNDDVEWYNHVGKHHTLIEPENTFTDNNPKVKEDIIRMIVQYLQDEGYSMCATIIQDETNIKVRNEEIHVDAMKRIIKAIIDGSWDVVGKLASKHLRGHHKKGFLYAICKQEYLELIDRQEYQKGFTYLTTHLKPMESVSEALYPDEFRILCYVLTCKSVNEVARFKNWDVVRAREKLVEELRTSIEFESYMVASDAPLPNNRLLTLLHQAVAYQMEFSRYHPRTVPQSNNLLVDFECAILPNAVHATFVGHQQNVKCVHFVGKKGNLLASGSSDNSILLWPVEEGSREEESSKLFPTSGGSSCSQAPKSDSDRQPIRALHGHESRIWDLTSSSSGKFVYSASGDGMVKLWNLNATSENDVCQQSYAGHKGDVYSVDLHPREEHIVSGGYDNTVRIFDIESNTVIKTFTGHMASVCDARFNPYGNLIVSGSKDGSIRFWDIVSGLCIRTIKQARGEITSIELSKSGLYLLSGSKNNSNRLWDIRRMGTIHASDTENTPLQRFKGHQNTAKNFIGAHFGPKESLILGGSENALMHVWDRATGNLLERFQAHQGAVYSAVWHECQSLIATCSDDGTVKTWWWDENVATKSN